MVNHKRWAISNLFNDDCLHDPRDVHLALLIIRQMGWGLLKGAVFRIHTWVHITGSFKCSLRSLMRNMYLLTDTQQPPLDDSMMDKWTTWKQVWGVRYVSGVCV